MPLTELGRLLIGVMGSGRRRHVASAAIRHARRAPRGGRRRGSRGAAVVDVAVIVIGVACAKHAQYEQHIG